MIKWSQNLLMLAGWGIGAYGGYSATNQTFCPVWVLMLVYGLTFMAGTITFDVSRHFWSRRAKKS